MAEAKQSAFEGWAVVELMGHQQEIGFVTTEAFGGAVMFRVDTPGLEERQFTLTAPEYVYIEKGVRSWLPAETVVKRPAVEPRSRLVSPAALYALNPCTEEFARQAIEKHITRPLILVERKPGTPLLIESEEAQILMDEDIDEDPDNYDDDDEETI